MVVKAEEAAARERGVAVSTAAESARQDSKVVLLAVAAVVSAVANAGEE